MTITRSDRPTLLLLRDPADPDRLLARSSRIRDRLAARLLASSLDRRLAHGEPPESDPLLATRAQALVAPDERRALAAHWEHLLDLVGVPPAPRIRRIPLCRDRIRAADGPLRDMLAALVAPLPVPARGVARAGLLLSDGSGPLYNPGSRTDLLDSVREVTDALDPWASHVTSV